MTELSLTGIDGANPLGVLATLGLLEVCAQSDPDVRVAWRDEGAWRPVLRGLPEGVGVEGLVRLVLADRERWRQDPVLALSYGKGGAQQRDLKPPQEKMRAFLQEQAERALVGEAGRRAAALAAAFGSDVVQDHTEQTKPTALHFTAGQQQFLKSVGGLLEGLTAEDVEEVLMGPWRYRRELPVLGWDSTAARDHALRATDPSGEKKTGVPAADWLAFLGLRCFPVAPVQRRTGVVLETTGCRGSWKAGELCWPLWEEALRLEEAATLLRQGELRKWTERQRWARGVAVVFVCGIRRSDQGGYGSFSPAQVV